MDAKQVFDDFLKELNVESSEYSIDETVSQFETEYYPHIVQILKKDPEFFAEDRLFCGVQLNPIWASDESRRDTIWKHLQFCLFASFLHGDIKEKAGKLFSTFKSLWSASGQENDEVTRLLNDEASEGKLQELMDYVSETRIAKIFMNIVEQIDVNELEIDFENPQEIIETLKNPENPIMKKVIGKIQGLIQEKLKRGEFTQQQLQSEIEGIKAKVVSMFGNVFNEALGGTRSELPPAVLMGNSPEARRQRMLARLQKKQRDRK